MKLLVSAATAVLLSVGAAQASTLGDLFTSYFVFGDSLSDDGNLGPLGPPPPYYENQFSNGPVWTTYLAQSFEDGVTTQNYAYGGAETQDDKPVPDLPEQKALFLADLAGLDGGTFPGTPTPGDNPLVSIWFGANDVLGAINVLGGDLAAAEGSFFEELLGLKAFAKAAKTTIEAAANVAHFVNDLSDIPALASATFLVTNLPDLGATALLNDTPLNEAATALTLLFNGTLDLKLALVAGDADVEKLDAFKLFNELVAGGLVDGIENAEEACFVPEAAFLCENPDAYAFWDGVHPTGVVHEALAEVAAETLGAELPAAVPLPATLPLFAAGLGLFGLIRRRG